MEKLEESSILLRSTSKLVQLLHHSTIVQISAFKNGEKEMPDSSRCIKQSQTYFGVR